MQARFRPTPPIELVLGRRRGSALVGPMGGDPRQIEATMPTAVGTWPDTTLRYMVAEATRLPPGNATLLAHLTELPFVGVLRHYMQELPPGKPSWLAGLNDPHVGMALKLLHTDQARGWTVEGFAQRVGFSRSELAEWFTDLIGESPLRYVTGWRMQLAKQLLREGNLSLSEVATRIGYESGYTFNRAFKWHVGEPPAKWRKQTTAPG